MAVAGPIFQRVQSKFSALYVHVIIVFSASHDLSGARNGIIDGGYTSASHDSVVPNKFHPPQDVLTFEVFIWIKGRKSIIQTRVTWEIRLATLWCFALMLHFVTYVWRLNGRSIRQAVNVSQPLSPRALQTGKTIQPSRNDLARLQPLLLTYSCTRSWSLLMPGLYQLLNCLFVCLSVYLSF